MKIYQTDYIIKNNTKILRNNKTNIKIKRGVLRKKASRKSKNLTKANKKYLKLIGLKLS